MAGCVRKGFSMTPTQALLENAADPPTCTCQDCEVCEGTGWRAIYESDPTGRGVGLYEPCRMSATGEEVKCTALYCDGGKIKWECEIHGEQE